MFFKYSEPQEKGLSLLEKKSSSCQGAGGKGSSSSPDGHTDMGMVQQRSVAVGPVRRCTRSHQPPSVALVRKCPVLQKIQITEKLCSYRQEFLCYAVLFRPQRERTSPRRIGFPSVAFSCSSRLGYITVLSFQYTRAGTAPSLSLVGSIQKGSIDMGSKQLHHQSSLKMRQRKNNKVLKKKTENTQ